MPPFAKLSKSSVPVVLFVLVGLIGCEEGGVLGDDCSSESDCDSDYRCVKCSVRNTCYFGDLTGADTDAWACKQYGAGTPSGGSSSGGSSNTGACAYVDTTLNRIVCGQTTSSGCRGKFFGTGVSCRGLSCTSNSPSSCTVSGGTSSGGSSSGGSSSGGSSGSCVGTNEICTSNTVSGCTIKFCAGGPGGCYYVANGKRFSCNGEDVNTCGAEAGKYCNGG